MASAPARPSGDTGAPEETPLQDPVPARAQPSDLRVELGHAIFALVEPHPGHERAWNRWYERDHLIAAGSCAPWTLSTQRWIATRREKALRYPARNPICDPLSRGSFLAAIWIQNGRYDDQQRWVAEQVGVLAAHDRNFDHRDVLTTAGYDYLGGALRDADGVPPELALDRRYPGVVLIWTERLPGASLGALRGWLTGELLPGVLEKSPIAMALCFTPKPKAAWWPKAAPEVPGVSERILVACFVEANPATCFEQRFAGLGAAIDGGNLARTLFVAPFVPVVPGVDPPVDELS
jgi:hypothetical protein